MMSKETFRAACLTYLHIPYIWGGDDPIRGMDCSGLVQELLAMVGLDPKGDQTAQALFDHFKSRSSQDQSVGSLVFYGASTSKITHVAMMLDATTIIEAGGGGSKTATEADAIRQNAFIRLRPFNRRGDVVAILRPSDLPF